MRSGLLVLGWVAVLAGSGLAQAPVASATGTVTGRVICGDTQLPARFAEVSLIRKPSQAELNALYEASGVEQGAARMEPTQAPGSYDLLQDHSGLDGAFTIRKVPPGEYWIVAKRDGYLFPIAPVEDDKAGRDLDRRMAAAQTVHVGPDGTVKADIRLERGGVMTGRVVFADGSPAVDWDVWLVLPGAKTESPGVTLYAGISATMDDERLGSTSTDDLGEFRMAGLPAGKYVLVTRLEVDGSRRVADESSVPETSGSERLLVYAPGVFSRKKAAVLEVHGAEALNAGDVRLDLDGLHTVRGRVLAKVDGLPITSTMVTVDGDGGELFSQRAVMEADGGFRADYVPPGNYVLHVIPGRPRQEKRDTASQTPDSARPQHFEHVSVKVVVGDTDVTVPDILLGERKDAPAPQP